MRITNMSTIHKFIHKFTWLGRNFKSIICYTKFANKEAETLAKDNCVYRGTYTHSDHFLVTAELAKA
jgi:hypothetical protein